jgi:Ca2+-binding RTX toxin-like protein
MAGAARVGTGNGLANTITGSGGADTLSGLDGNDILRGKIGADTIFGGLGEDLIDGGVGKDTMTGGGDKDTYTFRDGDMNNTRNTADIITDFDQAIGEKIGLTLVDANVNLAGDQSFEFIATNAFSNTAGELRYVQVSGNTFIEGDTNGDGQSDFMIRLNGSITLTAADMTGVQDNLPNGGAADISAMLPTYLASVLSGSLFY